MGMSRGVRAALGTVVIWASGPGAWAQEAQGMPADLQRALDTYAHALERAEWNQLKALLVEPPDKRGLAELSLIHI